MFIITLVQSTIFITPLPYVLCLEEPKISHLGGVGRRPRWDVTWTFATGSINRAGSTVLTEIITKSISRAVLTD